MTTTDSTTTDWSQHLTKRNVGHAALLTFAILITIGPQGVYILVLRGIFIGAFVAYRVRYVPRQEPCTTTGSTSGDEKPTAATAAATAQVKPELRVKLNELLEVHRWKGVIPHAVFMMVFTLLNNNFGYDIRRWRNSLFPKGVEGDRWSLMPALVWLPITVSLFIVNHREIADARKYEWRAPGRGAGFSNLFTTHERRRPWTLLFRTVLPLLLVNALRLLTVFAINFVWDYLVQHMAEKLDAKWNQENNPAVAERQLTVGAAFEVACDALPWLVPIVPVQLLAVAVLCPLEVACSRLAVQRNFGPGATTSTGAPEQLQKDEEAQMDSVKETAAAEADVDSDASEDISEQPFESAIQLRDEPYTGLFDCLISVWREEGLSALYRGAWVTLLFTTHGVSWEMIMSNGGYW